MTASTLDSPARMATEPAATSFSAIPVTTLVAVCNAPVATLSTTVMAKTKCSAASNVPSIFLVGVPEPTTRLLSVGFRSAEERISLSDNPLTRWLSVGTRSPAPVMILSEIPDTTLVSVSNTPDPFDTRIPSPATTEVVVFIAPLAGISRSESPVTAATPTSSAVRSASTSVIILSATPVAMQSDTVNSPSPVIILSAKPPRI